MQIKIIILLIFYLLFNSCAKEEEKIVDIIEEQQLDMQMINAYNEGLIALEEFDGLTAAKKFSEAELLFPQSKWAPRASLMAAYSYYSYDYYPDAIYELERFLKTYPDHPSTDYAYYLLGISYYDQIVDETKDLGAISKSKKYFEFVVNNFPNTDYAIDSKFKLDLIQEVLASKEMYLARYYFDKEKWIPSINRFKNVIENYDESIFIEEALYRLVEIHYILGLEEEAKKYAYLLGYNYQSSEWYEKSYKVFNKNYKKPSIKIKKDQNKDSLIEKIKSKIF